ncbi:MAG: uroporphyrinogen-III C-methyltransferase [Vicinamibacterales bacterium]
MSPQQTVYIVGAGPGDPSLISARGLRHLKGADVVVHDHLVHPRLLRAARPDAELIDVGAAAPHPEEHDAICLLLAEKAREGKRVVRLKWGDPFVFDSGGRAALMLHEQGIAFEVVPGVPALVAVPCYAGIPVSYPGSGDAVTFVRGYEDESDAPPRVDWTSLARLEGTIVCYCGAKQLPTIVRSLVTHGRAPDDSAAFVCDGTLPQQTTVQSTLGALVAAVEAGAPRRPGVLVVGPVVGLREHLRWFDSRPLFGRRIVVTRSREQAGELVERLEELGAEPIEASSVRIEPVHDPRGLDEALAKASTFDWIVFTSANGVDHFMRRLFAGSRDARALSGPHICTIGPSTAERFGRYGIRADLRPAEHHPDALASAMRAMRELDGARVLLVRGEGAREVLGDEFRKCGATVTDVAAYHMVRETQTDGETDIFKMLLDRNVDVVTFTSPTAVSNFVDALGEEPAADLLRNVQVASIGPVTAEAALQHGIRTTIVPAEYTTSGLVDAIVRHYAAAPASVPR